jgi:adenosylcobinamide-GDP ribazoletransferase
VSHELGVGAGSISVVRRAEGELRGALAFLTRIPVATTTTTTGAGAFGLVGALVGAVGALAILVLGGVAPMAAGVLAVGAMALVTGALHLDGLGDTADALAAPSADAAERARTAPRLGSAGVTAIAVTLLLDASLIGALVDRLGLAVAVRSCVAAASASRAAAVAIAWAGRDRARPGGATWFASHLSRLTVAAAVGSAALVTIGSASIGGSAEILIGTALGAVVGVLGALWVVRRRRGLDGDGLGTGVELAFAAILLTIVFVP